MQLQELDIYVCMGQTTEKRKQLSRQNSMDADMQVSSRPNMAFSWNQSNGNEISTINKD